MASSRSMKDRRRRNNRPPVVGRGAAAIASAPTPALDEHTGPIVLLAFLAAGLKSAVGAHASQVRQDFEDRIDASLRWPDEVTKLEELRLAWRPMRVEVDLAPVASHQRMVAPCVTVTAYSAGVEDRRVEIYLCRRGLVVLETFGWPTDVRAPAILKDPDSVESATKNATATVRALMTSLGRFSHPLDMT